jgi:DNA helicase II / ATP-dependent DNA helicase PcrA
VSENSAKILQKLNDQQIPAVKHFEGPALVVAGPGSGKTRVLTYRIAYLISEHGVSTSNILCVTFTNKASGEIKERVVKILKSLGNETAKIPWSGTFHSVCARILRKDGYNTGIPPSFAIYDTDDQLALIKQIMKDFGIDKKQINPNAALATISSAKAELVDSQEYSAYAHGYFQRTVAKIYPEYQKRLRDNDALDFDDILVETVRLFSENKAVLEKYQDIFKFILIDEYQDTNKAQYVLTKLLSEKNKNLYVVGDMAQAIYSFRGADYRNILNFQKDFSKARVYNLEQNYRSTQTILDAASNVIKNNSTHIHLDLWTNQGSGEKVILYTGANEQDEADFVVEQILNELSKGSDYNEMAVLYRTNAQSRNIEEHLIKSNIPYKIVGGFRFYARREIKDIISYLRAVRNPKDTVSWERIINTPPRGIGKKAQESLKSSGWNLEEIQYKTGLPFIRWYENSDTLATIELMDEVLEKTGYIKWLDDGSEESLQRIENIKELRSVASAFNNLDDFLENVALIESSDKPDVNAEGVTLMTIHASKGLEFKTVFLVGMEEGLFPHSRSMFEMRELEEERRLCYVAMTRAKENLYLTQARQRLYFGKTEANNSSRFIEEIPQNLIKHIGYKSPGETVDQMINDFLDEMEVDRRNFSWE